MPSQAVVAAPTRAAAVTKREPMSRQQAVAISQERRNAGRKPRPGADGIDPMDPVMRYCKLLSFLNCRGGSYSYIYASSFLNGLAVGQLPPSQGTSESLFLLIGSPYWRPALMD